MDLAIHNGNMGLMCGGREIEHTKDESQEHNINTIQ